MTEPNSVSYMFEKKGVIVVEGTQAGEDKVYEIALENGADDVRTEGGIFEIVCPPEAFESLRAKLQEAKVAYQMAELSLYPKTAVKLDRDAAVKVLKLVSGLEDLDDVQHVAGNFDISDQILKEIEGELG